VGQVGEADLNAMREEWGRTGKVRGADRATPGAAPQVGSGYLENDAAPACLPGAFFVFPLKCEAGGVR
jgi:hypothetical protein